MTVGLFIPCYVDQLFPKAGIATLELLEKQNIKVVYPEEQTCCGQPMANSGCVQETKATAQHFINTFSKFDYVVSPSGSCTSMVRNHYSHIVEKNSETTRVINNTYELCEFLVDIVKIDKLEASFPHKVGVHQSCHGLRELRLAKSSEQVSKKFSKVHQLLKLVNNIELVELQRNDECCGFGGTFAITEEDVSCAMGKDRIEDHLQAKAEYITATDLSCLMHLDGLIKRNKKPLKIIHVAEILNHH